MTLIVTGGCGFIGSELIRQAIAQGRDVVNIDALTYAANAANLAAIENSPHYTFKHLDIRDGTALKNVFETFKPDAVIHMAAESHVDRSIEGAADFISTNINGTFNMLEAARDHGVKFLHVSTDEVYGDLSASDPAFTETTPYAPSSPYSASKAASDHLVRAWGRTYGLPVLITNCSNNYGPFQFPEKLIPVIILSCLAEQPIPVYGKGENIRDWLYVGDHAKALFAVLDKGGLGETYNIGGNNERRNIDIVHTICAIMDAERPRRSGQYSDLISFVTDRPGHDRRYAVNASKIKSELGWEPTISADEGFAATVRWYLENRNWWEPLLKRSGVGERLGLI
ncbi:dTDP-glucose 4,6-dehydratase [Hellea balneolensis]|uniref:dTDP-glucose 4,6-dehydratase n=1 Tax=Hellea balneolensis TaxID=287478 RepID=UPI000429FAE5|nr:dTDP-glucose 4,6-dehydratase [Hellea balneolensis]